MAQYLPNLVFSEHTSAGLPAVGYKLWCYVAGTTTPKDTYTTPAGDTPNDWPVTLDSDGRAVVCVGAGAMKLRLEDDGMVLDQGDGEYHGQLIWEIDNVNMSGGGGESIAIVENYDALRALVPGTYTAAYCLSYENIGDKGHGWFDYRDIGGADDDGIRLIPDTNPNTGRWMRQFSDYINVRWFGAVDGSDCVAQFSAADSAATEYGYPLCADAGTYELATDPGLVNPIKLYPDAILKPAAGVILGDSVDFLPIIDPLDDTAHFDVTETGAGVELNKTEKISTEWFYTGTNDYAANIQAAVDAGIDVFIPRGVHNVASEVWIPRKEQRIRGDGGYTGITVLNVSYNVPCFNVGFEKTGVEVTTDAQGVRIEDIRFTATLSGAVAIKVGRATYGHVERCHFSSLLYGVQSNSLLDNRGWTIRDVFADECTTGVYDVRDNSINENQEFIGFAELTLERVNPYRCLNEGMVLSGPNTKVIDCVIRECGEDSGDTMAMVKAYSSGSYDFEKNTFDQNGIVNAYNAMIQVDDSTTTTAAHVGFMSFYGNTFTGTKNFAWYVVRNVGSKAWNYNAVLQNFLNPDGVKLANLAGVVLDGVAASSLRVDGYIPSGFSPETGLTSTEYMQHDNRTGNISCIEITTDTITADTIDADDITALRLTCDTITVNDFLSAPGGAYVSTQMDLALSEVIAKAGESNSICGVATLNGSSPGSATVNTSVVKSGSLIFLTYQSGTTRTIPLRVETRTAGVSFTVGGDSNQNFFWFIINPG